MMRVLILLSLLGLSLAQQRCVTPGNWTGDFYESEYKFEGTGGVHATRITKGARVSYDAESQQIHIREFINTGGPFPDEQNREYHDERLIQYIGNLKFDYHVVDGECAITQTFNGRFIPFGPSEEAVYRGTMYIGGEAALFPGGVQVEIYDTQNDDDDPDAPHYYGTWARLVTLDRIECVPVTEEFYQAKGRLGYDEVYTGHVTFYNVKLGVDTYAFQVPKECYAAKTKLKKKIL